MCPADFIKKFNLGDRVMVVRHKLGVVITFAVIISLPYTASPIGRARSPETQGHPGPDIPYDCPNEQAYSLWDNHHGVWTCQECPTGQTMIQDTRDGQGRRTSIKCSLPCPSGQVPVEVIEGRASCDCPSGLTGPNCGQSCDSIALSFLDNGYVELDGGTTLSGQANTSLVLPRTLTGIAPWLEQDFIEANNKCQAESDFFSQVHWRTNAQNQTLGFGYYLAGCVARMFNTPYFGQDGEWATVVHGEGNANLDPPTTGRYSGQATCQHAATLDYPWTWYASFFPDPRIDLDRPIQVCEQSTRYFDLDGNPIDEGFGVICSASMLVHYSPISLLWNGSSELSPDVTVGYFRLDPKMKEGQAVTWRGSDQQPLLVFDPEHSGEVVDFRQVFGPWAFGGKTKGGIRNVSLKKKFDPNSATPWSNGYEALSVLDSNKNRIVEGDELAPLALWFDSNQDGRAQKGEVRPAIEMGLKKLFTKTDRIGENGKDLYATKGFVRDQDGSEFSGTTVDWYADPITSMKDLTDRLSVTQLLSSKSDSKSPLTNLDVTYASATMPELTPSLSRSNFDGVWMWKAEGKSPSDRPDGILVLSSNNGKLIGHAYTQYFIKGDPKRASVLSSVPLKGTYTDSTATIEILSSRQTEVKTKIVFDSAGKSLKGDSVAQLMFGKERLNTRYAWTAQKVASQRGKP